MKLKKLGTALGAVLILVAVSVSSASAAAVTEEAKWYEGESLGTEITGSLAISAKATENAILETTVAETPLTLKSTALSCSECSITNSTGSATGSGKIVFESVTAVTPAGCAVEGGKVTTKALTVQADWMEGTTNLIRFKPTEGTTFATLKLIKGSGACPIAGSYNITGVLFEKTANSTDVAAKEQQVFGTPSINSAAGGELKFGAEMAKLTNDKKFWIGLGGVILTYWGSKRK